MGMKMTKVKKTTQLYFYTNIWLGVSTFLRAIKQHDSALEVVCLSSFLSRRHLKPGRRVILNPNNYSPFSNTYKSCLLETLSTWTTECATRFELSKGCLIRTAFGFRLQAAAQARAALQSTEDRSPPPGLGKPTSSSCVVGHARRLAEATRLRGLESPRGHRPGRTQSASTHVCSSVESAGRCFKGEAEMERSVCPQWKEVLPHPQAASRPTSRRLGRGTAGSKGRCTGRAGSSACTRAMATRVRSHQTHSGFSHLPLPLPGTGLLQI